MGLLRIMIRHLNFGTKIETILGANLGTILDTKKNPFFGWILDIYKSYNFNIGGRNPFLASQVSREWCVTQPAVDVVLS